MKRKAFILVVLILGVVLTQRCQDDDVNPEPLPEPHTTTPYDFTIPEGFPQPIFPDDNRLTVEGVKLGRHLFYEKGLSRDGTQACGSCHLQQRAFTDVTGTSTGITGAQGTRKAMALFNLAWQDFFFWDGRAATLEEQALLPIVNPIEMDNTLKGAVNAIKDDTLYQRLFKEAFGSKEVTPNRIAKAIAQFERTIISANSKYDRVKLMRNGEQFTPSEERGFQMFISEEADCFHCHGPKETGQLFGSFGKDLQFVNNGLKAEYSSDEGLAEITGERSDIGKFKIPSVRNVEFSFPYMHDGSIPTLDSLVGFYNFGGHKHFNVDPNMKKAGEGRNWTVGQRNDLEAFLRTLTDFTFLQDSAYSNPFED